LFQAANNLHTMTASMTEPILAPLINSPAAPLCLAVNELPDDVSITLLYQGNLPDSSQIFIVRDARNEARAIVQLSAPASPEMVARGVARAREAATAMGSVLARSVLLPTSEGEIDGRSYAIMPYCIGLSSSRWRWYLQRIRVRSVIFDWLRNIAAKTASPVSEVDLAQKYEEPLRRLLALDGTSDALKRLTRQALDRLVSGAWTPQHVMMHGDLWRGNMLLRKRDGAGSRSSFAERVAIIDWAGAKPRGYAFFDLLRAGDSLRANANRLRAEALQHCKILGCDPRDAASYTLAAMAGVLCDLGEFPLERFMAMAETNVTKLMAAMPELRDAAHRAR
jgi:Phosphotransferase enzyme family